MGTCGNLRQALEDLIGEVVTVFFDGETLTGTVAAVNGDVLVLCVNGGLCFVNINNLDAVCTEGAAPA